MRQFNFSKLTSKTGKKIALKGGGCYKSSSKFEIETNGKTVVISVRTDWNF